MGRGAKSANANSEGRPTVTAESRKVGDATSLQLEQRLAEALEQHAAISKILQVISASPSDVQPVLDTVAASAARLCGSSDAEIFRRDGDSLRLVAHHGLIPSGSVGTVTLPLVRESINGRATLAGQTVHVADLQAEADEFPFGSKVAHQQGWRTHLCVPMMRAGVAMGTISLRRTTVELFTERRLCCSRRSDQAVIAIENVRLFNETKEALERQNATSEILRRDQQIADGCAAGIRHHRGGGVEAVWREQRERLHVRRRADPLWRRS
jgi:GAF domain-containing protein